MPLELGSIAPKDRIIFALDVATVVDATRLIEDLAPYVGAFKVGLELLTSEGQDCVRIIHQYGGRVFYDGKFNDIPNTVAGAAKAVAKANVWMFNVHACGGREAIRAAVTNKSNSLVAAVTVLTSMSDEASREIFGEAAEKKVQDLATIALEAGVDALICSAKELSILQPIIRSKSILTVVPGIRPAWSSAGDQARIMTPAEAVRAGASYVVIGRPIRTPPPSIGNPVEAAKRIAGEIAEALQSPVEVQERFPS